ncbi:ATP-grasp domain-containing protein [Endothiovibrio diazotrophicus]
MSATPPILLVGTSFSAAPLLHALKAMGRQVAVCGAAPNDPCVAWADRYFPIDYSDPHALLELVRSEGFSALCPSCNDYAYLSAATAATALGLPGFDRPEATTTLHDKAAFRAFAQREGLPVPRARPADAATLSDLRYPVLVKPTDSFSGRGCVKLDDPAGLPEAITEARRVSRRAEAVVEEFIDGALHSHSAFLRGQAVAAEVFVDEFCTVYPYQVNCSNAPSRLGAALRRRVRESIDHLATTLDLTDGLLHTQFMVRGDEFFLIECMRRCPGDLYSHLVSLSTGVPYIENYLRPFLGQPMAFPEQTAIPWARHTLSLPTDAVIWSFSQRLPAAEVRYYPLRESGSQVRGAPYDKFAILFARFEETGRLFEITPALQDYLSLNTGEQTCR